MVILHSYVSLPEGMKAKETRPFGPDGAHALKAQTSSQRHHEQVTSGERKGAAGGDGM